jgi:hypothetical protein
MTRRINVKNLPDGRPLIHWFIYDANGPIKNPTGKIKSGQGEIEIQGARGRLACRPWQNTVQPQIAPDGEILMCLNTGEALATTCPECQATEEYKAVMAIVKARDMEQTGKNG